MNYNLKETKKLQSDIFKRNYITENEILRLKHFYKNACLSKDSDYLDYFEKQNFYARCFNLTNEQKVKGFNYLKKRYFKLSGQLRNNRNIKFGKSCLNILEKLKYDNYDFKFCGFVIISNGIMNFIEPIYLLEIYDSKKYYAFRYFNYCYIDYEFNFEKGKYLKDNQYLFIKDFI